MFIMDFSELKVSTITVMVYLKNFSIDLDKLFTDIPITPIELVYTKKQNNIKKDSLKAPYGTIISIQTKTQVRGVDTRKNKNIWCIMCKKMTKTANGKDKKMKSAEKILIENEENDIKDLKYKCTACQGEYTPKQMKKIGHFLNQRTIIISLGGTRLLNAMIFKNNIKVTGVKSEDDVIEMIQVLYENYLSKIEGVVIYNEGAPQEPGFIFDTVMKNFKFNLGINIDRNKLNILMNNQQYSNYIKKSTFNSTLSPNVNIKMFTTQPNNFAYRCLLYINDEPFICPIIDNSFKKQKEQKPVTFIVFRSSEVILSGKYDKNMEELYYFFVSAIKNNIENVIEVLSQPDAIVLDRV